MKNFVGRKAQIIAGVSCIAMVSGIFALSALSSMNKGGLSISVDDFKPGTELSYEVFGDGAGVFAGKTEVDSSGRAKLPVPEGLMDEIQKKISYKLKFENPDVQNAQALELLLDLDKQTNLLSVVGNGLGNFADVDIKNGDQEHKSKADWTGMFKDDLPVSQEMLELAFQNNNLASDAVMGENAKIEVLSLFGESSRNTEVASTYGRVIRLMSLELTSVLVMQTKIIGTFFDAKIQMETQRKIQELKARAHKDYQPSEQMCRFGTFIRSVASTESKSVADKKFLNKLLMNQYLGVPGNSTEDGEGTAAKARIEVFKEHYCNPHDNNSTLDLFCPAHANMSGMTPAQRERLNKDIDYTRTIDSKLTLNVDFADATSTGMAPVLTNDELDVITMAKNLYMPQSLFNPNIGTINRDARPHFASRSLAAKMNVAHTSYLSIVGLKVEAPEGNPTTPIASLPNLPTNMQVDPTDPNLRQKPVTPKTLVLTEDAGWSYMKAMMREFNMFDDNANSSTDDEIEAMLGVRPSYYAQMEILTKKIYQSPNFYTNLYDKPANVKRIGVAMDAIALMNLRDRYDSQLRQEMLTSLLVEEGLAPKVEQISADIYNAMKTPQGRP